jgi:DNA-binding beta-propeller fold protein YncE
VFPGRVQAVTFCGTGEVAVAVSLYGNEEISILSTDENRLLSQVLRPNRLLGIQGALCNAQSKELLVADAVLNGSPPLARIASVSMFRASDLRSEEITDQHAPQIGALELPADAKPPVAVNSGAVGGIGASEDGRLAAMAITGANEIAIIDTVKRQIVHRVPVSVAPFTVTVDRFGSTAWASNWGGRLPKAGELTASTGTGEREDRVLIDARGVASSGTVSRIDITEGRVTNEIEVGLHPTALAWDEPHNRLYVVNGNSDSISVVDTAANRILTTWSLQPFASPVLGIAPTAVVLSPGGIRLYVTCGGINAVAVVETAGGQIEGLIPTGWYPGHLAMSPDGKTLAVATLLGVGSGSELNADVLEYFREELPDLRPGIDRRYVHSYRGTVHVIPVPEAYQLEAYTRAVAENTHLQLRPEQVTLPNLHARPLPVPLRSGEPSLIEHVIYIVKENRTYDQLFGDLERGNGDPSLLLYGEDSTPNHRALARQFVVLDNFYATGGNSGDGHQWVTQAAESDYAMWPGYDGRSYPFDGDDPIAYAGGGFLWDAVLNARKSFVDFGEFIPEGQFKELHQKPGLDASQLRANLMRDWRDGEQFLTRFHVKSPIPPLDAHLARDYPSYGSTSPDVVRARIFLRHLKEWEQTPQMPNLIFVQLASDHTAGTAPGWNTPKAAMADNDMALGQIVEGLTHSKFWPKMTIFVVEDDAQGGVDHVDGHRTVALVISPYVRRQSVDSTFYSHPSITKTIELMLGLPSLSLFDLIANDMRNSFTSTPDVTPYTSVKPKQSLFDVNPQAQALTGQARRDALASAKMNWRVPDAAPSEKLNRILWRKERGPTVPYPKPKQAVFAPYSRDLDDDDRAENGRPVQEK